MEEIYWIQRIGAFKTLCELCTVISFAGLLIVIIDNYLEGNNRRRRRRLRRFLFSGIFSLILSVFVPSEKDMYAIYGIGGTIDYIKSNEKAMQLPDKVVNALDKWIDDKTKEVKE